MIRRPEQKCSAANSAVPDSGGLACRSHIAPSGFGRAHSRAADCGCTSGPAASREPAKSKKGGKLCRQNYFWVEAKNGVRG
jgi:hypothetical protein